MATFKSSIAPRRALVVALVTLLASVTIVPVSAQDSIDDARARQEQIQRESAELAAQIDELNAEDEVIVEALAQIDAWVAAQESRLERARQALEVNREIEADANQRAVELADQISSLRDAMAEQLVASYIGGFRNDDELILGSADINDVPLLRFAIDESTGASLDSTDLLRAAMAQQADAIAEAEQATRDAEELEDEIEDRIEELDESRAAQERLRAEVTSRIDALEADTAVLASEDQEIEAFIRAEQERIRQEEEARREAERREQERLEQERLEQERLEQERLEEERRAQEEQDAEDEPEPAPDTDDGDSDNDPGDDTDSDDSDQGDGGDDQQAEPQPDNGQAPNFSPPVNASISSGFGNRIHPIYGTQRFHSGLDYGAPNGSAIGSAATGTVIFVGFFSGYGNTVIVQHTGGYTTLYAHMSGFNVSEGASVSTGDTVGFVGSTGLSTGPHLHFEIRLNGTAIDPLPLL